MPIDPSKYILPPPVGTGNELYEPFPVLDNSNNSFGVPSSVPSAIPIPKPRPAELGMQNPSPQDYSFGLLPNWDTLAKAKTQLRENPLTRPTGPTASEIVGSALGLPDLASYFVRAIVVILGFIFVAVGLTILGAQSKMAQTVVRETRRVIP